jgi:flagellar L-ring protein precursor FlgH
MKPIRAAVAVLACTAGTWCAAQSLYTEDRFQSLTADRRALKVGDALTVLIFESSSASQSADTVTEKGGGLNLGVGVNARNYGAKLAIGEEFNGKGRIQRSGRLAAQITVTVAEVLGNGDLRVAGRQQIVVNGENQVLQLSGRVRPVDVNEANTVVSTRIADAEINYVGDGILAEKQRQGVLTRFMSWLGLL